MNLKEKFDELYSTILASKDERKMKILGCMTKKIMYQTIESHPQRAEELLEILEAVNWNNYLTEKEADQIVSKMSPAPRWSRQQWKTYIEKTDKALEMHPYYNKCALYVTMCMIDSDSGKTIKALESNEEKYFEIIYSLATDKLLDKDGVFNIRHYFCELL